MCQWVLVEILSKCENLNVHICQWMLGEIIPTWENLDVDLLTTLVCAEKDLFGVRKSVNSSYHLEIRTAHKVKVLSQCHTTHNNFCHKRNGTENRDELVAAANIELFAWTRKFCLAYTSASSEKFFATMGKNEKKENVRQLQSIDLKNAEQK